MGILKNSVAVSCAAILLIYVWNILNWVWFRPKKLEKCLRQQGLVGNSYKLLFGDFKEMTKMKQEAKSKPIEFSNDIVHRVSPFVHNQIKKYGKNTFLWSGATPTALIMDPAIMKEVMLKTNLFPKPPLNPLLQMLVKGIGVLENDEWAKHRRLLSPPFYAGKLKHMLPAFRLCCREMLSKWDKIVTSKGSSEIDVWPYLQTLGADVISRNAFGSNYEEGQKIFELQTELSNLILQSTNSFVIPGWRFLPTKANRRMKEISREVKSVVLGIIQKRMKAMEAGEASSGDMLGVLLESNFNEIQQYGSKHGMTLEDVIEECKFFYLAGQETTSSLLAWTMILLGKHLDWQARAREEVLQVLGKGNLDFDFDKFNHLKIITMIFHEVLRLYPPIVTLARMTQKEVTLGHITIPAGVELMLPTIFVHHDTKLWGDDANEFKPGRFSDGVSKATDEQFLYFPFGWGPRLCIGRSFAILEAKISLAMILQNYAFEVSPSYVHAPHTLVTLKPQHGAQLIFHKL